VADEFGESFAHDLIKVAATLPQPPILVGASLGSIGNINALFREIYK
jgi:hypothetical protein